MDIIVEKNTELIGEFYFNNGLEIFDLENNVFEYHVGRTYLNTLYKVMLTWN